MLRDLLSKFRLLDPNKFIKIDISDGVIRLNQGTDIIYLSEISKYCIIEDRPHLLHPADLYENIEILSTYLNRNKNIPIIKPVKMGFELLMPGKKIEYYGTIKFSTFKGISLFLCKVFNPKVRRLF